MIDNRFTYPDTRSLNVSTM